MDQFVEHIDNIFERYTQGHYLCTKNNDLVLLLMTYL